VQNAVKNMMFKVEKLAKRVISFVNIVLTITTIVLFVEKKWRNWSVKANYGNGYDL